MNPFALVRIILCVGLIGHLITGIATAQERILIRGVAVNETHIVFGYAGDLWRVPITGGNAEIFNGDPGDQEFPVFSPDGTQLVYASTVGGNMDVYRMSAEGDDVERLTYHPKRDVPRAWSPDGASVLFTTGRDGDGLFRLYEISYGGGFPKPIDIPMGYTADYSPDGSQLVYAPVAWPNEFVPYRYYRGGMMSPMWLLDRSGATVRVAQEADANHRDFIWVDKTIYYTSDSTGTFNLYAYRVEAESTKQLTEFSDYGIDYAAKGNGVIVFTRAGLLYVHHIESANTRAVQVSVEAGRSKLEPRQESVARSLVFAAPAPQGDAVVFEARGNVFAHKLADGTTTNLTGTSGAAEREPAWSPDGEQVAFFSDESGEYELHIVRVESPSDRTRIAIERNPTYYRQIRWSPDSRRIAFTGKRLGLWLANVADGDAARIDGSNYLAQEEFDPNWSVDGRYLTYSKSDINHISSVYVYDCQTGGIHRVTEGIHAHHPVFDRNGRYLHFIASNTAGLAASNEIWGLLSAIQAGPFVTGDIYTVLLRPDVEPPFEPVFNRPNTAAAPHERAEKTSIAWNGIERRIVKTPVPMKNFVGLVAGTPGVLYATHFSWPDTPATAFSVPSTLSRIDFGESRTFETIEEGVGPIRATPDGRVLLMRNGAALSFRREGQEGDWQKIDLGDTQMTVDPTQEWRQMYHEAWRIMRDFFHDSGHHGQDLGELGAHFAEYLPTITRRSDLNLLFEKMFGHVSNSHIVVAGGDSISDRTPPDRTGVLGADFTIEDGRYRINRVFRRGVLGVTNGLVQSAPLDQPAIDVREGDYLIAIEGNELDPTRNLYEYLQGRANRPTEITVSTNPNGEDARTYSVIPLIGDNSLHRHAWFEDNRRRVEEATDGRISYIAMPSYGLGGIQEFIRQLLAASGKDGIIIDQRFNGGGVTSDVLVQMLTAQRLHHYAFPYGEDLTVPNHLFPVPKVLIVNENNFSAAETFPLMFKIAGAGTIVGKRTGGGGAGGALEYPTLVDGGRLIIPNRSAHNPKTGQWAENNGVAPDVEVEWWPEDWRAGRDPQLEKAIEIAMDEARRNKPDKVKRPENVKHP